MDWDEIRRGSEERLIGSLRNWRRRMGKEKGAFGPVLKATRRDFGEI